jgi:hypothetical protein
VRETLNNLSLFQEELSKEYPHQKADKSKVAKKQVNRKNTLQIQVSSKTKNLKTVSSVLSTKLLKNQN